jgi:hypothetical protein
MTSFTYLGACLFSLRISVTEALVLVKRSIFRLAMGNLGRSRKGCGSLLIPLTLHRFKGLGYDIEKTTSLSFPHNPFFNALTNVVHPVSFTFSEIFDAIHLTSPKHISVQPIWTRFQSYVKSKQLTLGNCCWRVPLSNTIKSSASISFHAPGRLSRDTAMAFFAGK